MGSKVLEELIIFTFVSLATVSPIIISGFLGCKFLVEPIKPVFAFDFWFKWRFDLNYMKITSFLIIFSLSRSANQG